MYPSDTKPMPRAAAPLSVPEAVNIHYVLSNSFQLLEHCLALYEWMGGEFHITPNNPEVHRYLANRGARSEISGANRLRRMYRNREEHKLVLPSGSHDFDMLRGSNTYFVEHGVSEKAYYLGRHRGKPIELRPDRRVSSTPPLQFSRFLRGTQDVTRDELYTHFNIDPRKKTVLYLPTQGTLSSIEWGVVGQIYQLRSDFNVVVKPHALQWELGHSRIDQLRRLFGPTIHRFHNVIPFVDIADLIIGDVSAATAAATLLPEKPIILIKHSRFTPDPTGYCMNPRSVTVLDEHDIRQERNLAGHARSLIDGDGKSDARREYFRHWFGEIDGFEGRRYAESILSRSPSEMRTSS